MMGPTATKLDLQLGAGYTDTTNLEWSIYFDNAVVDTPRGPRSVASCYVRE